jgi:hypothetical protein
MIDNINAATWPTISTQIARAIDYAEGHGLDVFTVSMGCANDRIVVDLPHTRAPTISDLAATGLEWTVCAMSAPYVHLSSPTPGGVFALIILTHDAEVIARSGVSSAGIGTVMDVSP